MGIDDTVADTFAEIQEDIIKYIINHSKHEEDYNELYSVINNDLKWNRLRNIVENYAYELVDLISNRIQNNGPRSSVLNDNGNENE